MIISDLNYLEVVAEADSVVGGANQKKKVKKVKLPVAILVPFEQTQQSNVAVVNQNAKSESAAIVTGHGNAESKANATNVSTISQANVN